MKKYLLFDNNPKTEEIINNSNFLKHIKDPKYIYIHFIKKLHFLQGDMFCLFGKQLKKNDRYELVPIQNSFIIKKNNKVNFIYFSENEQKIKKIENGEIFIYRGISGDIRTTLQYIENNFRTFKLKVKGNFQKSSEEPRINTKRSILGFLRADVNEIFPDGIIPLDSQKNNKEVLEKIIINFGFNSFVIKNIGTCLGQGIHFFENGISEKTDLKKFKGIIQSAKNYIISQHISSEKEIRIYFTNKDSFQEIFGIIKTKRVGEKTHHSNGIINYEIINTKQILGKSYKKIIKYITTNNIKFGAMDIILSQNNIPYVLENNQFSDILCGENFDLAEKRINALDEIFK